MGRGRRQKFIEADRDYYRERILKLHQEGISGTDIAKRLDISVTAVSNFKKRLGLTKRKS